jgi:hypothetical protein
MNRSCSHSQYVSNADEQCLRGTSIKGIVYVVFSMQDNLALDEQCSSAETAELP